MVWKSAKSGDPEQELFFDESVIHPDYWAWVVQFRGRLTTATVESPEGGWSFWFDDLEEPCHFRSEAGAKQRLWHRENVCLRKVQLGVMEFRVKPKYLGCVPDKDEKWIAD